MSFWGSFSTLLGLGVLYLLVPFPFGIVLLALPAGLLLGGHQDLVMLLGLVTAVAGVEGEVVDFAADEVSWVSGSGSGRKRIRLNRKTPAHLVVSRVQSRPRVWKRLRHFGHSSFSLPDPMRRRGDQDGGGCSLVQIRIDVG